MRFSSLLTSAGINICFCALFLTLYSILRRQPGNVPVYFGRRLAQERSRGNETVSLERLIPSASWLVRAWQVKDDEILSIGGLDAVVFLRLLVFSIRIFSIAALVCVFGVLPVNYYFGKDVQRRLNQSESLGVFTIGNINMGSRWLLVHCFALWVVSCSACILLYSEYHALSRIRMLHITKSPPNPSHFSVILRSIPESSQTLSDTVRNFFTSYHGSSYLSHQVIYRSGNLQKIMYNAEKVYKKFVHLKDISMSQKNRPSVYRCGLCRGRSAPFHVYHSDSEFDLKKNDSYSLGTEHKECSAAIVFFKTRYAAYVAAKVLQSSNPMLWVASLAPEPSDLYWSHLWIPHSQIWIRRIASHVATVLFMILFIGPVSLIQVLTQLEMLQQLLPLLKGIQKKIFLIQLVSGYLPSVILVLFLYSVPPLLMLFSTLEGSISRSGRKKSVCCKILYFTIWNVFFVNVSSGTLISQLHTITSPKDIPSQLAKALPIQATFFITFVLASGWASLCTELLQLYPLTWNFLRKYIFRCKDREDYVPSFPYHTEVPRVLFFGLLGFTYSILAPLILPFLLVYFFLGYLVYRNQIINVYQARYDSGGRIWPLVHNTTIFSLLLTQIIALGVFGMKGSPVALGFTVLLLICTLLFNEYCRKRFYPVFRGFCAQDLIDMDREDEEMGRIKEIHQQLLTAYEQYPSMYHSLDASVVSNHMVQNASEG